MQRIIIAFTLQLNIFTSFALLIIFDLDNNSVQMSEDDNAGFSNFSPKISMTFHDLQGSFSMTA